MTNEKNKIYYYTKNHEGVIVPFTYPLGKYFLFDAIGNIRKNIKHLYFQNWEKWLKLDLISSDTSIRIDLTHRPQTLRLLSSQPIEIRVFDEDNILYEIKIENCKEETLLYLDQFEKRLIIDEGNPKVRITGDTRLLDSMKFSRVDSLSLVNSQVFLGNFSFSGNQLVMEQVEGNIEDFNLDLENLRVVDTTLQSNYGRNIIDCVHLPVFRNSYWLCEQPICYNKDMIGSKRHGILLSDHSFSPIDIDFARARLTYILENLRRKTYSNMNRELYPVLESLQDSMAQLQAQYDVLKEVENSIYKNVPPKLKVKTLFKDNKD